jgi:hypothetical protein
MSIIGRLRQPGDRGILQRFRVRAGVFASAHGRPDGMPGRIIGARAKGLRGRTGREDLRIEMGRGSGG